MSVRPYADSDLEALATLHAVSRRHAYAGLLPTVALDRITPASMITEWADRLAGSTEDNRLVVDEEHGALAGFSMCTIHPDRAELNAIHVHPDHHGTGVAAALHDAVLDVMRAAGCPTAYLWVVVGNERAQAFYRRNGWTFDGTRDQHAIGGVPADIERWTRRL